SKLGTSGLINAYRSAAADALNNADIAVSTVKNVYQLSFTYQTMNDIMKIIKEEDLESFDHHYDNDCSVSVKIRLTETDRILGRLKHLENVKITKL
ncbi:MAG: YigZ family protein, partial [Bacteroidetes bacterium]|nr:YigZ family protein [Bacteroidota bacterium]